MKAFILTNALLGVVAIYLFVSAPQPLNTNQTSEKTIHVSQALEILEQENDIARALYTKEIVGVGSKQGLKFDEHWEEDDVYAGPLPAQFLRLTALSLEKNPIPLGLFLGSDYAISKSNAFEGEQLTAFQQVKITREAAFFYVADAQRYAYIAPDIANVKACVTCHNEHEESPKKDWKLNDVMGGTTWTYPNEYVSYEELLSMIAALRQAFRDAYLTVLAQAKTMKASPTIGTRWPDQGRFLPEEHLFLQRISTEADPLAMSKLMSMIAHPLELKRSNTDE